MLRYAAGRIVLTVPVLFGVSLMSFAIVHLIPGDIVSVLAGPMVAPNSEAPRTSAGPSSRSAAAGPIWHLADRRASRRFRQLAGDGIAGRPADRLPSSGDPGPDRLVADLGDHDRIAWRRPAATARGRWPDLIRGVALLGLSTPPFFVGVAAVLLLSIYLPSFKTLGAVDLHHDPLGGLRTLLLPAFVLSLASATTIMRYTRVAMLEVLAEPYMATARAKGAGRLRVLIRHGLRNALLPVVTAVGVTAAHLIAGAVVVEQVFGLPGIGQLMLNAIYHRDYPQVQATVLVITTLVVLINIMIDLSYYLLDPRIQQHG